MQKFWNLYSNPRVIKNMQENTISNLSKLCLDLFQETNYIDSLLKYGLALDLKNNFRM